MMFERAFKHKDAHVSFHSFCLCSKIVWTVITSVIPSVTAPGCIFGLVIFFATASKKRSSAVSPSPPTITGPNFDLVATPIPTVPLSKLIQLAMITAATHAVDTKVRFMLSPQVSFMLSPSRH